MDVPKDLDLVKKIDMAILSEKVTGAYETAVKKSVKKQEDEKKVLTIFVARKLKYRESNGPNGLCEGGVMDRMPSAVAHHLAFTGFYGLSQPISTLSPLRNSSR